MQTVSSRTWTLVAKSILHRNNRHAESASFLESVYECKAAEVCSQIFLSSRPVSDRGKIA